MKTISVWNGKGGPGKTTLSLNLAGAAHKKGLRVLLIDDDVQRSSALVGADQHLGFEVSQGWPEAKPQADLIIVDMSPRTDDTPLGVVVMPCQPTRLDWQTTITQKPELEKTGLKVIEVINRVDNRIKENREFALARKKEGALIVANRGIYQRTIGEGCTIFNPKANNIYGASAARNEINLLLEAALNE